MKKFIILIFIIIFFICVTIFYQFAYKFFKTGNNISKSDDNNILNISSYEAIAEVEYHSNKNVNKYVLSQKYAEPNIFKQEVVEPENMKGITIIFDGTNLQIENTNLNLKNVYKDYSKVNEYSLSLISFIKEYENTNNAEINEIDNEKTIKIKLDNQNKYQAYKKLYINKKTNLPSKMEILDVNENITVYILYREIKINKTSKEQILGK